MSLSDACRLKGRRDIPLPCSLFLSPLAETYHGPPAGSKEWRAPNPEKAHGHPRFFIPTLFCEAQMQPVPEGTVLLASIIAIRLVSQLKTQSSKLVKIGFSVHFLLL